MSATATPSKYYLVNKEKPQYCAAAVTTPSTSLGSDGWLAYYLYTDPAKDCAQFSIAEDDNTVNVYVGTGTSYKLQIKGDASADDSEAILMTNPSTKQEFEWNSDTFMHSKNKRYVQPRDSSAGTGTGAFGSVLVSKLAKTATSLPLVRKTLDASNKFVDYQPTVRERAKEAWSGFKWVIIAVVVLLVLGIAFWLWRRSQANSEDEDEKKDADEEEKPKKKKKAEEEAEEEEPVVVIKKKKSPKKKTVVIEEEEEAEE